MQPPAKPRKDFPLFAHRGGSWTAVIDGRQRSFGGWRTDPDGSKAMANYRRFLDDRNRGYVVPAPSDAMPVRELANRFLTAQQRRMEIGGSTGIRARTFLDMPFVMRRVLQYFGAERPVVSLRPEDFSDFIVWLKTTEGQGVDARNRHVRIVRQMFRWATENEVLSKIPNYGSEFSVQRKSAREKREKLFSRDDCRALLDAASVPMRAMILLGLNAGMGNTDIGVLHASEFQGDDWLDTFRHKTEERKRCPLWPETVAALQAVRALGRKPADGVDPDLVFLSRSGRPWVEMVMRDRRGRAVPTSTKDAVQLEFRKLMRKTGVRTGGRADGRGFYTLKRTCRTIADEVGDHHAAALVVGHNFGSVAGLYVQKIDDTRLLKVANYVREKLLL